MTPDRIARLGEWLHRYLLPTLLVCYVVASVAPAPGLAIRHAQVPLPGGGSTHPTMLLLALLLFCAAVSIRWTQIRDLLERPMVVVVALLSVWLGPALVVSAMAALLPRMADDLASSGLLVGLALAAAMPVANSSAGWSQNAGGNVALSLGLVVLSIILSPIATPQMLKVMGMALSLEDTRQIERVVAEFSGARFIAWVILPSVVGAVAAWVAGAARIAKLKPWIRLATLVDLLLLNYSNAALALPKVWSDEPGQVVAVAGALAVGISLIGACVGFLVSWAMHVDPATQKSILFSLSMKHTGLALVLAGEILDDQPRVILLIVLATLSQHVVAAGIDWLNRSALPEVGTRHV
ncbi:MAG: bile acid:sodium symporter [Planctomycetales bacterium]|nr:bile acid:sodium symporter [Planctomycetales bacterium]